jgi:hypothetical protein
MNDMTTTELKSNFHILIDNISNENILAKFYDILSHAKDFEEGMLWNRLTFEEQEELLIIEKESHNFNNLISHLDMQKKHKKWL